MAPNDEVSGLRTALAMGAEKPCSSLIRALAGADALTTAKVLAGAVGKAGDYDLIIAGTESSDGYTGTVPEQMAEVLGLPSVGFAKTIASRRRHRQGRAPNRSRLRRGQLLAPRRGLGHRRCRRAALPQFQGHHGCQEQAGRDRHCCRPRRRSVSWAQSISSVEDAPCPRSRRIIEDDGETFNKIVDFLDNLKVI